MAWRRLLLRMVRSRVSRVFIGWVFAHMSWAIPAKRLYETDTLIAFYHPVPSYPVHILIVPKSNHPNMEAITATDQAFLVDIFTTVRTLANQLELSGYRLICNGGEYQDVPQLHFHLISDDTDHTHTR